jgi:hypothetical protein
MEMFIGEDKLREAENLPHDLSGKDSPKKMFEYSDLFSAPGVSVKNLKICTPPPHHTGDDYNFGSYRQPRKLTFGMQPYSNPTR